MLSHSLAGLQHLLTSLQGPSHVGLQDTSNAPMLPDATSSTNTSTIQHIRQLGSFAVLSTLIDILRIISHPSRTSIASSDASSLAPCRTSVAPLLHPIAPLSHPVAPPSHPLAPPSHPLAILLHLHRLHPILLRPSRSSVLSCRTSVPYFRTQENADWRRRS
ncbi:uncharacterized protein F5891DRAFT_1281370 [Suillus fuscotomentosus]|uniref:Uncharacterized protein n=1 Tax=Suillus fuscotomentosus TaxID=1912939 RepID=A0AAD4DVQ3_9AGAM|nr:uncharacterized protein F5891DRAFT_1281370 [Suillus fuscotomentosus]KAG1894955.1 hypothetical protein F5891DRAFT_1281370 [Suillus fuscotomentosus]